jgi:hypothetical protein
MKPASFSPSVGLNQHPLWTSAFRTILKTRHEIACQKSQGRPSQKKEGAESEPVHITGQATVALTEDNRNRKRSRAPCPCWFEPTCSGACARLRCPKRPERRNRAGSDSSSREGPPDHRFHYLARDRQHRLLAPNDIAAPPSGRNPSPPPSSIAQARRFSWSRELICDIRIGPRENSPTSAFRVSPRK